MNKMIGFFLIALIAIGMWLPSEANASGPAQWRQRSRIGRTWQNDRGRRRNGRWYGYKNYGQYRRTQVGNRRYRLRRTYIWRNGVRIPRLVRVYY